MLGVVDDERERLDEHRFEVGGDLGGERHGLDAPARHQQALLEDVDRAGQRAPQSAHHAVHQRAGVV